MKWPFAQHGGGCEREQHRHTHTHITHTHTTHHTPPQVADPEDACEPLRSRCDDEPWVALISRSQRARASNCTFDVKVRVMLVRAPARACNV
jgi:hypothetical protein